MVNSSSRPYPDCSVAIFALGAREAYRPILYSTKETFCSPDCADSIGPDGLARSFHTPGGVFDVKSLSERPEWRHPEIVVVKADATGRNYPRGLSAFRCPKVLIVGNTQHLESPIQNLLAYAESESFDFITSDHKRHHLHFFAECGFPRIAWLPALNIHPHPQTPSARRLLRVLFVGQKGKFHPYRGKILDELKASKVPLFVCEAPQEKAASLYMESLISLNCSLNGDLNLRVFEVLSSGGFLLTDRLSPEAGLEVSFQEGRDYEAWGNPAELIEKARFFLANPQAAADTAMRGCKAFWARHAPETKAWELIDWVSGKGLPPEYAIASDRRTVVVPVQSPAKVRERARIYEHAQEIQLQSGKARILVAAGCDWRIVSDLIDLPRMETSISGSREGMDSNDLERLREAGLLDRLRWANPGRDNAAYDLAVVPANPSDGIEECLRGHIVFALSCDGRWTESQEDLLYAHGFKNIGGGRFALERPDEYGKHLLTVNYADHARSLLLACIPRNPEDPDWLTRTALLAINLDQLPLGERLLRTAIAIRPTHSRARRYLSSVLRNTGRESEGRSLDELRDIYPRGNIETSTLPLLTPKRILVLTNLFPPQELGGYGRLMCDFSDLLRERGHTVEVLTSNAEYLGLVPDGESGIERTLRLFGRWEAGKTIASDPTTASECVVANQQAIAEKLHRFRPDACLLGNIDFLGSPVIRQLLEEKIPILHHLGNQVPGYAPPETPTDPRYRLAAASVWLARQVAAKGYPLPRIDVIYPGAFVQEFKRPELPRRDRLRIAYASIVLPYKGAHILTTALGILHQSKIPFSCTIAGTTTDPAFVERMKAWIAREGFAEQVRFVGFLDRSGLQSLYADHNVLLFPTQVEEAFGISQVEAMAAGLAVITSGRGGAVEVIEDGINGIIAPATDPVAFARALAGLMNDPNSWERLAQQGRKRALEYFDIQRSVDQIEETLKELLT